MGENGCNGESDERGYVGKEGRIDRAERKRS